MNAWVTGMLANAVLSDGEHSAGGGDVGNGGLDILTSEMTSGGANAE